MSKGPEILGVMALTGFFILFPLLAIEGGIIHAMLLWQWTLWLVIPVSTILVVLATVIWLMLIAKVVSHIE